MEPAIVHPGGGTAVASNDGTIRDAIWYRYAGDDWAAFDQLPQAIQRRLNEHAYDAWSVNALMLWQRYRRLYSRSEQAQRALLRYLDYCEHLERQAFANNHLQRFGMPLPREAAHVSVLRYRCRSAPVASAKNALVRSPTGWSQSLLATRGTHLLRAAAAKPRCVRLSYALRAECRFGHELPQTSPPPHS